jgi:hypothetical protein
MIEMILKSFFKFLKNQKMKKKRKSRFFRVFEGKKIDFHRKKVEKWNEVGVQHFFDVFPAHLLNVISSNEPLFSISKYFFI